MRRLLKIDELDNLQKKRSPEEAAVEESDRRVKRQRTSSDGDNDYGSVVCGKIPGAASCSLAASKQQPNQTPSSASSSTTSPPKTLLQKLVELLDSNGARDVLWWLPGKKGRGFALNRKIFEHKLLKVYFGGQTLACFLRNLNRWGFRQVCNPSLPENVIAFEKTCFRQIPRHAEITSSQQASQECSASSTEGTDQQGQQPLEVAGQQQLEALARSAAAAAGASNRDGLVATGQQQPALLPTTSSASPIPQSGEELMQSFVPLLWLELQRQLSTLLLQAALPLGRSQHASLVQLLQQRQLGAAAGSASLVRHQQRRLLAELASLHQQQISNLTYQIVALVAANLDQQQQLQLLQQPLQQQDRQQPAPQPQPALQQHPPAPAILQDSPQPAQQPQPALPSQPTQQAQLPTPTQRILVKYLVALVLLRLQHHQQYLGSLRQERVTALALLQSIEAQEGTGVEPEERVLIGSMQLDQLMAETATLSLWRAQQLLAEAAELVSPRAQEPQHPLPQQVLVTPPRVHPTRSSFPSAEPPGAASTVH